MVRSVTEHIELSAVQMAQWEQDGYLIIQGLFGRDEMDNIQAYFDAVAERGEPVRGWSPDFENIKKHPDNVLLRYPRFMHPHRVHEDSKAMLLDARVFGVLSQLLGEEAVACQSMYYFKPPGAKGQALHQDNFYLDVEPGTCIAAWTAVDRVSPENGGLYVVPGTHKLETQCPETANANESFTTHLVSAPKGMKAIPTIMDRGDVLFFNGQVIHGSGVNRSKDQWRRSFISHYMPASSRCVSESYFPILDAAGNEIPYDAAPKGGPCGLEFKPSSYDV